MHHLSQYVTLEPGDLILTGTPQGVALSGKYPYLAADDVVEIEIDGLGRQRQEFRGMGGPEVRRTERTGGDRHRRSIRNRRGDRAAPARRRRDHRGCSTATPQRPTPPSPPSLQTSPTARASTRRWPPWPRGSDASTSSSTTPASARRATSPRTTTTSGRECSPSTSPASPVSPRQLSRGCGSPRRRRCATRHPSHRPPGCRSARSTARRRVPSPLSPARWPPTTCARGSV